LAVESFPPPDGRDRLTDAPEDYKEQLRIFTDEVANCMRISREYGGIRAPTTKHFFASALFTSIVTRAVSLVFILPYSYWSKREFEHWDYASAANISRTIMETRLNFFYLCVDECSDGQWDCRWNLFNLHDAMARVALMRVMDNHDQERALIAQADELRTKLNSNAFFRLIPEKRRKELLKGSTAHLCSLEEIASRARIDLRTFKLMWKFMSAHVHALPLSFYRMVGNERGRGVQTPAEEAYTKLTISFALVLLVGAREEYVRLMESAGPLERMVSYKRDA
jgi:Family of unknown function (DUF5677)